MITLAELQDVFSPNIYSFKYPYINLPRPSIFAITADFFKSHVGYCATLQMEFLRHCNLRYHRNHNTAITLKIFKR